MRVSVVPKKMTSFKLSDATRAQITRIRDARNGLYSDMPWFANMTNTDVIRSLCKEECERLDQASKLADQPQPKREVKRVKAKTARSKKARGTKGGKNNARSST